LGKRNVTIYLDDAEYLAYRKAIHPKSVSSEIGDFMRKRIAELSGQEAVPVSQEPVDYEAMDRDHDKLVREVDRQERWLKKRKVYSDLLKLAASLGVTSKDLSGLEEAAPNLLKEWTGLTEDAFKFISLLRNVRAKRELERKMTEAIKEGKTAETQIL